MERIKMEKTEDIGQMTEVFIDGVKNGHIGEASAKYLADHRKELSRDQVNRIIVAVDELFEKQRKEAKEDDTLLPLWYLKLAEK
jgi:hypothetical protein